MSITSEIERIKTNIANAYTELENKGATIPTEKNSNNLASTITTVTGGGGSGDVSINGKIEQKIVASGSVSKGDFVVATEQNKSNYITSDLFAYNINVTNVSGLENLNDDPDTYCSMTCSGSSTPWLYFHLPSYEKLGISSNALILNFSFAFKVKAVSEHPSKKTDFKTWTQIYTSETSTDMFANLSSSKTTELSNSVMTDINVISNMESIYMANLLGKLGCRVMCQSQASGYKVNLNIYTVLATITYLDNGIVKTVTTTADTIVGVANSDGAEGDTIDVYVPNVGEEGVSYMNRMMKTNEELQEKATAYDILTGEEE